MTPSPSTSQSERDETVSRGIRKVRTTLFVVVMGAGLVGCGLSDRDRNQCHGYLALSTTRADSARIVGDRFMCAEVVGEDLRPKALEGVR